MKSLNNLNRQKESSFEDITDGFSGFETLMEITSKYMKAAENPMPAMITGAREFTRDLGKLTRPMSEIRKAGYTHLIDTFDYEIQSKEVVVGWGKYYGRMVEYGTSKMAAREHFRPVFENNKEKYYKKMLNALGINTWN